MQVDVQLQRFRGARVEYGAMRISCSITCDTKSVGTRSLASDFVDGASSKDHT
ncbi:hypothetical protein HYDPIDRAFT_108143 [Hydnomerulius pinastri MD-312]|uniref:Uncharacterized protein n=1 Tax=Hydnomerulius pinastri MD-312 TaxID=994086 RepID=A0A0C9UZ79_9AGAM|nr:hypothetical protein HYDPIDRAFT_119654 [Hydnomerulius pinastri MD-312]KIJ67397.1 hypothetical protein HYDPIDRAFT_108143 [Hydnomerulius pinastri MD-312]